MVLMCRHKVECLQQRRKTECTVPVTVVSPSVCDWCLEKLKTQTKLSLSESVLCIFSWDSFCWQGLEKCGVQLIFWCHLEMLQISLRLSFPLLWMTGVVKNRWNEAISHVWPFCFYSWNLFLYRNLLNYSF